MAAAWAASAQLRSRQPLGVCHCLAMKRCESGARYPRGRASRPSSVLAWRCARKQGQHQLLLQAHPFREHGRPRLRDSGLLLPDHPGEFLAIAGTDRGAGQRHACESMCHHLRCRKSELSEFDGRRGSLASALWFPDHCSSLVSDGRAIVLEVLQI